MTPSFVTSHALSSNHRSAKKRNTTFSTNLFGCPTSLKRLGMEGLEKKGDAYPAFEIDFNGSNHAQLDALEQPLNA